MVIDEDADTSKTGAYMALMSTRAREEIEELAGCMDYIELGVIEGYEAVVRRWENGRDCFEKMRRLGFSVMYEMTCKSV